MSVCQSLISSLLQGRRLNTGQLKHLFQGSNIYFKRGGQLYKIKRKQSEKKIIFV